jgi:hypothetical protein
MIKEVQKMNNFDLRDLKIIENSNIPLSTLRRQMGNMLQKSAVCTAKVESIDQQTGEYRVILHGKLDLVFQDDFELAQ